MPIRTKRWDDPADPADGWRVLFTRYRPRGVKKRDETWDEWRPELGPRKELHALFWGKVGFGISWESYAHRYIAEMSSQRPLIAELARRVAAGEIVTLMCSSACVRESRCHRSLLKELIEEELQRLQQAQATH